MGTPHNQKQHLPRRHRDTENTEKNKSRVEEIKSKNS